MHGNIHTLKLRQGLTDEQKIARANLNAFFKNENNIGKPYYPEYPKKKKSPRRKKSPWRKKSPLGKRVPQIY
jgi:hypothetical protein